MEMLRVIKCNSYRQNDNWNEKGLDYADVQLVVTAQSKEHGEEIVKKLKEKGYLVQSAK